MNPQKQLYEIAFQSHLKEVISSQKALRNYLAQGGDPDARVQGNTLLFLVKEQYHMCKMLLNAGADVNATHCDGSSLLEYLITNYNFILDCDLYHSLFWINPPGHHNYFTKVSDTMKLFIEHGAQLKDSLMQLAVDVQNPMAVEVLIDYKLGVTPSVFRFAISNKAVTLSQKVAMQLPLQDVIDVCLEFSHEDFVVKHLEEITAKKKLELSLAHTGSKKVRKL